MVPLIVAQVCAQLAHMFGSVYTMVEEFDPLHTTRYEEAVLPVTVCRAETIYEWIREAWNDYKAFGSILGVHDVCHIEYIRTVNKIVEPLPSLQAALFVAVIVTVFVSAWEFLKWYTVHDPVGNRWKSKYISMFTRKMAHDQDTATLRSLFMNCPNVVGGKARNHTHPDSAAARNDSSSFMDLYVSSTGRHAYRLQRSAADVRRGRDGCRTFHWAKDLSVGHSAYNPGLNDVICMVDVDMYIDMPSLLSSTFQPVLLSTFQPSAVAHSSGEYSYSFNDDDVVTYDVSGGAKYVHKVWNYGPDVVMSVVWRWGLYYCNIYNVDRRSIDNDHQLVLLTPIRQIVTPFWCASWLKGECVKRLRVAETVDGVTFLRLNSKTKSGMMRSTGKPNTYLCANISASDDDTLASMSLSSKSIDLTIASVKTVLKECDQSTAAILTEYHRAKRGRIPDTIYPVEQSVFRYQYRPSEYEPEAKASMKPFMAPLVLGCYAPDLCLSNDKAAVKGRVTDVKADPDIGISSQMLGFMDEFITFLIPEPHVGHPLDFDDVWNKQARPAQRQILLRAGMVAKAVDRHPIQSFQKKEAYGKITEPRIISTIPGVSKNNYSRYIYSFTTCLRATSWYAFACTPLQIACRVAMLCLTALWAVMTDLSRFDGRVSTVLRTLEKLAMLRYFAVEHHKELTELMASQQDQRAYTSFGEHYETGTTRASGSAETADFNSMDNAFLGYVSLRRTAIKGRVYTPEEAWEKLGIYGGDDGVTPDVDPKQYVRTCTEVGQVLEVDLIKRGEPGVTFLARAYGPDVWHGANDSMCDLGRQLSKLHTTPSLPPNVTPLQKLSEKLYAYYLTDSNTPVLGQLASVLVECFPELVPEHPHELGLSAYHSRVDILVQYPNMDSAASWMTDETKRSLPEFNFDKFNTWLELVRRTKDPAMLLKMPLCGAYEKEHTSKVAVVVNGEVINPPPLVVAPRAQQAPERKSYSADDLQRMAQLPCRQASAPGGCKFGNKCRFKH